MAIMKASDQLCWNWDAN